jgi:hypothetical protein
MNQRRRTLARRELLARASVAGVAVSGMSLFGAKSASSAPPVEAGSSRTIDFITEYGAVRSAGPGDEEQNADAFRRLLDDLRNNATRGGSRKIDFGPADGTGYFLNQTVEFGGIPGIVLNFDCGPTFNESMGDTGLYFVWTGGEDEPMFRVNESGGTNQRGLTWQGYWNMFAWEDGIGWGIDIDSTNNWGGPASGLGFGSNGGATSLKRGIVTRSTNDNAHSVVGALYASQVHEGAVYCIGGGFNMVAGNISVTDGQTGLWGGPNASEMKIAAGVKFDGNGAYAVDWAGRMANFSGFQIEGFDNGVGIRLRREGGGTSGRANIVNGVRFVSSYGGQIPWIAVDLDGGGGMFGNTLVAPTYSNTADPSVNSDPIMLPSGVQVFDLLIDPYRTHSVGPIRTY